MNLFFLQFNYLLIKNYTMKKLSKSDNVNNSSNGNKCTAYMFAKMTAANKGLSQSGFSRNLVDVRSLLIGHKFVSTENYKRLLKNFSKVHFIGDPIETLFKTDIPWLLVKMEAHTKLIQNSVGKHKIDYQDQRSAIRAFIDYILSAYGFDIAVFNWRDALDIYKDYKVAA